MVELIEIPHGHGSSERMYVCTKPDADKSYRPVSISIREVFRDLTFASVPVIDGESITVVNIAQDKLEALETSLQELISQELSGCRIVKMGAGSLAIHCEAKMVPQQVKSVINCLHQNGLLPDDEYSFIVGQEKARLTRRFGMQAGSDQLRRN